MTVASTGQIGRLEELSATSSREGDLQGAKTRIDSCELSSKKYSEYSNTLLDRAVENKRPDILYMKIGDPIASENSDNGHLMRAIKNGDIEFLEHLTISRRSSEIRTTHSKNVADVYAEMYGDRYMSLDIEIKKNNVESVKWLLKNGARVNRSTDKSRPPLHSARNPIIIKDLLKFGADIDAGGFSTALDLRARECNARAVALLLEYGADINLMSGFISFSGHNKRICPAGPTCDDGICAERTRDVLVRHQIKMQALGLHVESPWNTDLIAGHEKKLQDFRESCQEEVKKIKGVFIKATNVSYHDILRKHARFLAKYTNNVNIVLALESEEYKNEFPVYASMIKAQFRKGLARSKMLKLASPVLHRLSNLPEDCLDKILDHLSYGNLTVLVEC